MLVVFFFGRHKPDYELRISDGCSDGCSSDLGIPPQSDDFLIPCHPAILGPNPITKPSRRPNGEQLGPKDAPGRLVAFPSVFRPEMEAIWSSRRDLHKRAEERRVGKECVSTCRSGWFAEHIKNQIHYKT